MSMDAVAQRPTPKTSRVSRRNAQERDDGEPNAVPNVVNVVIPPVVDQPLVQGPQLCDPHQLRSVCDSLGLHLSSVTKGKIHKGEFVDLGSLLTPPGTAPPSFSFSLIQEGQQIVLGQQLPKPPTIMSIEQWTSAFIIFMSVYLEVHNDRAIEMLQYMDIVRSAAQQYGGMGWRTYDIQFRLKQSMQPSKSWSAIDSELWLRVLLAPASRNFRPSAGSFAGLQQQSRSEPPSSRPTGICWAFNGTGGCKRTNCAFQHRCSTCRKFGHAATKCNVRDASVARPKSASFAQKSVARVGQHTN